jgi:hypothetical protein
LLIAGDYVGEGLPAKLAEVPFATFVAIMDVWPSGDYFLQHVGL